MIDKNIEITREMLKIINKAHINLPVEDPKKILSQSEIISQHFCYTITMSKLNHSLELPKDPGYIKILFEDSYYSLWKINDQYKLVECGVNKQFTSEFIAGVKNLVKNQNEDSIIINYLHFLEYNLDAIWLKPNSSELNDLFYILQPFHEPHQKIITLKTFDNYCQKLKSREFKHGNRKNDGTVVG